MIITLCNIIPKQIRRIFILILLFAFFGINSDAQERNVRIDTVQSSDKIKPILTEDVKAVKKEHKTDSTRINVDDLEHSPRRAMIYSIVLPGLGQGYNKKYFKIPIVYAALGGVVYWINYNTQGYRQASVNYSENQTSTNERYLKGWRRNLELSYITLVAVDALQVLDAYVDANLFYWDVSPDLSIRLEPSLNPIYTPTGTPVFNYGFKCKLTF